MRACDNACACSPTVPELTTDGGRVSIHENGNLVLALSGFEKDGNLVSFVSDEMFVHVG